MDRKDAWDEIKNQVKLLLEKLREIFSDDEIEDGLYGRTIYLSGKQLAENMSGIRHYKIATMKLSI